MIQPATAKAPPPTPAADTAAERFSPHLENEISKRTAQTSSNSENLNKAPRLNEAADISGKTTQTLDGTSGEKSSTLRSDSLFIFMRQTVVEEQAIISTTPENGQYSSDISTFFQFLTHHASENGANPGQLLPSSQTGTFNFTNIGLANDTTSGVGKNITLNPSSQAGTFNFSNDGLANDTTSGIGKNITLNPSSQAGTFNFTNIGLSNDTTSGTEKNIALNFTSVEASTLTLTLQSTEQKPENNALLLELQKIIANSNETGMAAISISDVTQKGWANLENLKPSLTASEMDPLSTTVASDIYGNIDTDGSTSLVPGSEIPVDKSSQNLAPTRHSIQQQYYDGKISPDNDQENEGSIEDGRQENTFTAKTAPTVEGNISTTINQEQPNTFAQPLASAQETQKAQTAESLKPVTLPSGTVVHQEEVVRQIVERFQISRRDTDTRVNIQLHPAELGELKIDLSVKEGSIRANVIAGSQYAQDIIEKNMVKLRSVLESQGFTVAEISVTCKSDTTSDFNLFERQLFSHNQYTPAPTKNTLPSSELFILDNSINQGPAGQQGVNVKI